jgi:hypothetical protein
VRASSQRRSASAARLARALLGLAALVVALCWPRGPVEAAPTRTAPYLAGAASHDGGACGEAEEAEQVDCAALLERTPTEPVIVTLMRELGVHMSERACTELMTDVWADESCQAQGRDCGKMNSGAPPRPAPKLASSATGRSCEAALDLDADAARRLARRVELRAPASRDLQPPVPPPRLRAH